MPHGHCYLWLPSLLVLHVGANAVIAASYFSIPLALAYFVRKRRDLVVKPVFMLFGAFILLCGLTHLSNIWTIWNPDYWLDGIVKGVTALVSLVTAVLLWPLMPYLLKIPSRAQLTSANDSLHEEIILRARSEEQLRQANLELSRQAQALKEVNERLREEVREREHAERRARESEIHLRAVNDAAPVGIFYTDPVGRCRYVNQAYQAITGLTLDQSLGEGWRQALHPEDAPRVAGDWRAVTTAGGTFDGEYRVRTATGAVRWVSAKAAPARDGGHTLGYVGTLEDVTGQREARERLEAALQEKETLLKEIHHRVKNNLQVVHSLLDLQAGRSDDPAVAAMFRDSQARVRSMALIHQTLYQSKNLAAVAFDEYLAALTREMEAGYGGLNVRMVLEAVPLTLDIQTAIPCGLWVSELASNGFKHAFPDGRPGRITVGLAHDGAHMTVTVADDGVGLPADAGERGSLGNQLVRLLAEQVGGEMRVENSAGSRFALTLPTPGRPTAAPMLMPVPAGMAA